MRFKSLLVVSFLLTTVFTVAFADGLSTSQSISIGIGAIFTVILSIFSATKLGSHLQLLKSKIEAPSSDEVDKLVESILSKIGFPSILADIIGDVTAKLYSTILTPQINSSRVAEVVVEKVSNLGPNQFKAIIPVKTAVASSVSYRRAITRSLLGKTTVVRENVDKLVAMHNDAAVHESSQIATESVVAQNDLGGSE
jgi:hypothetical protein